VTIRVWPLEFAGTTRARDRRTKLSDSFQIYRTSVDENNNRTRWTAANRARVGCIRFRFATLRRAPLGNRPFRRDEIIETMVEIFPLARPPFYVRHELSRTGRRRLRSASPALSEFRLLRPALRGNLPPSLRVANPLRRDPFGSTVSTSFSTWSARVLTVFFPTDLPAVNNRFRTRTIFSPRVSNSNTIWNVFRIIIIIVKRFWEGLRLDLGDLAPPNRAYAAHILRYSLLNFLCRIWPSKPMLPVPRRDAFSSRREVHKFLGFSVRTL